MTDELADTIDAVDPTDPLSDEDLSALRAGLAADERRVRRDAARKSAVLAGQDAETFRDLIEDLAPLLEDERVSTAQHAATAFLTVAGEYREDLIPIVPQVVTMTHRETNAHRQLAANLLATIVVEYPGAAADDVHRLLTVLHEETGGYEMSEATAEIEDEDTRRSIVEQEQREHRMKLEALGTIANVVVAVAEAEPSALFDHVDELVDLYGHDDGTIAGTAIDATAEVARADPAMAAPAFDDLVATLDRDDERVQARAVRALGFLEDERAVEPLEDLAARTDRQDLADLARETAAFLDAE